MLKRVLPYLIVLLVAIPAAILLFHRKDKVQVTTEGKGITFVPEDAVWMVESASVPGLVKALVQSDPLFPLLQDNLSVKPYLLALRKIDSLITRNARFRDLYAASPVILSLHQTGRNQYQFVMILQTKGSPGADGARELFTSLCGNPGQWSQRTYNGQQIHRVTFGVDAQIPGVSLAVKKGFLVITPSPVLLENAVRQMNGEPGSYTNPAVDKLSGTAGKNALATVYVNLKIFPAWLAGWMNPGTRQKLERFTRYGDWAALDLSIRNDAIWLNGFALEGDTLNSYLNLFRNQEARKLEAERYLPAATAAYFVFGVDKPGPFLKGLSDYLAGSEQGRKRQRLIDKAVGTSRIDMAGVWSDLGFRELSIGYLCGVADETIRPVVMVEVKNGNAASTRMLGWLTRDEPSKSRRKAAAVKTFKPDTQHEYPVYRMPFEGLPEILGGDFFSAVSGKYFTCLANDLILADDIQTLEEILHKYSLNKTLANDAVYQSMAGLISTRSNATFFAIPYKARSLLKSILSTGAITGLSSNDQFLQKTGAVGLQFNSTNGMSFHNLFASFAKIDYSKPQTIWESRLDGKVLTRPFIVDNHLTRDKEILVQDEAANLYLLNSSGKILWKKNIGEPINSDISQIDVMKNGRLQYIFSTANGIHLIDRNGNYLPKYPVRLKLPATCGMALVDFDRTRDYRIFIPCKDNKVYAFDKNGVPLKGWNFGPASGPITQPVQHFKVQNKDYLVFTDPVKVYFLDRKGVSKIKPSLDFAVSRNNRVVYDDIASGKGPRFRITDVTGAVQSIFLDGGVEALKCGEFSPDHYFSTEDLNQDGFDEMIFADRNKLEIFKQSGEKLVTKKLDGNVTGPPGFYLISGKLRKIGLTVGSKGEILLLNADGTIYNGFPLEGQTLFTTGSLEKSTGYINLLVGSDDGYLYNYAIK